MAITPNLFREGAVGFIDWLDFNPTIEIRNPIDQGGSLRVQEQFSSIPNQMPPGGCFVSARSLAQLVRALGNFSAIAVAKFENGQRWEWRRSPRISNESSGSMTGSIYRNICAMSEMMIRRITVSTALVIALFTATVRLPAATCIITNTTSEKPCAPGSCANKTCCATSHQRTGSATQPLAKATSDQQNVATIGASISIPLAVQPTAKSSGYSSIEPAFVSVRRLALLCTFLI